MKIVFGDEDTIMFSHLWMLHIPTFRKNVKNFSDVLSGIRDNQSSELAPQQKT